MRKNISRGILFILTMMVLMGCSKEKMELKSKSLIVEYGNTISNKAEDYLKNDADFLKNIKVENLPKNEKDKEYPSVGEYEIILKNDNQEEVVNLTPFLNIFITYFIRHLIYHSVQYRVLN